MPRPRLPSWDLAADVIAHLLPHRPPALRVDRVVGFSVSPLAIAAVWRVGTDLPDLAGHFPGAPLLPGAATIEALAQTAGLLLALEDAWRSGGAASLAALQGGTGPASAPRLGMLAAVRVKLLTPVRPPALLHLEARAQRSLGAQHRLAVTASVDDVAVAEGTITLALAPKGAR
jgi:3-hydroxyacyl-[acyl-carrier-protein] dehydratase